MAGSRRVVGTAARRRVMGATSRHRVAGAAATFCAAAGATAVIVALVAGPTAGFTGYVSEAGVADSGYAGTYRGGVLGLAAGLLLLAAALRPAVRIAAALLVAGGAATATSGLVTCSAGCPLPPFERTDVADLAHGGASIAAVASCVFAMAAVTLYAPVPALRRLSGTATAVALPLSAAVGLAMLLVGRGHVAGVLERLLLADLVLWAALLGAALALRPADPKKPVDPVFPADP
ncbi:DUF998 domain-containing protein [Plantactinospora siamensis]|uniref:DUF998 domain-containing protein n=1 Tax=Plantactinospora siamensis TaxID=555372 RepID=A0ABV6NSU0_9ACTN